jgi:hypothetical protein
MPQLSMIDMHKMLLQIALQSGTKLTVRSTGLPALKKWNENKRKHTRCSMVPALSVVEVSIFLIAIP